MGDTSISDFGRPNFGINCTCHLIPNAIRVPKMYTYLIHVRNLEVMTILKILCGINSLVSLVSP